MAVAKGIIQRLFAEAVSYRCDRVGLLVIDGEGKHPHKPVEARLTPLFEGMQHDLSVGLGVECVPASDQFLPQFSEIVDLPIVDDPPTLPVVTHGHMASL